MTAHWTVCGLDVVCGSVTGEHVIPAGDPVRVYGRAVRRCAAHASVPVDWASVDAARQALDATRARTQARTAAPITRVRPPRKPVPLSAIAADLPFDPRAAAAGDAHD